MFFRRQAAQGGQFLGRLVELIGASAMGAVFSLGVGTGAVEDASPEAIAGGMQTTFVVAAAMMLAALLITRRRANGRSKDLPQRPGER